ncbi:MAG: hypothetical protein ABEL97_02020 [Salinibacter sp.]
MRKRLHLCARLFLLAGVLGLVPRAQAQQGPRMYDPARVDTVEGIVATVDTVTGRRGPQHKGIHLQMEADDSEGRVVVHVGPLFYLQDRGISFQPGEAITVRGARMAEGAPVFIAAELWVQDQSWQLRDDRGRPAWRGRGRPNP